MVILKPSVYRFWIQELAVGKPPEPAGSKACPTFKFEPPYVGCHIVHG
jgi:hypothetical protein